MKSDSNHTSAKSVQFATRLSISREYYAESEYLGCRGRFFVLKMNDFSGALSTTTLLKFIKAIY
jgi:hypothetical protein